MIIENAYVSKALFDLENKHCTFSIEQDTSNLVHIHGSGPIRLLMNYQKDVLAYTKGKGQFQCVFDAYKECVDQEEIINQIRYDSEADLENPTGSIFCEHGAGYFVAWDEVKKHMHISIKQESSSNYSARKYTVSEEEVKRIFNSLGGNNKQKEKDFKKKSKVDLNLNSVSISNKKPDCLIVDGYNMIFAWNNLKSISNIESARDALMDQLSNYQGYKKIKLILVFDGYRVKNSVGSNSQYAGLEVVYTKYNQTADRYIEKLVHELKGKYDLSVASSDGLIQNAIFANGAKRMSARELEIAVKNVNKRALSYLK